MRSYGVHHGDAFKFSGSVLVARDGELLSMGHYGRADAPPDRGDRHGVATAAGGGTASVVVLCHRSGLMEKGGAVPRR